MARTKLEINEQLAKNQQQVLRALSFSHPETSKMLHEAIFQELKAARNAIVNSIKFETDPRGTAHAVRRYVARKYLGGVVSILPTKHSPGPKNSYEPPRTVYPGMKGKRGGNRTFAKLQAEGDYYRGSIAPRNFFSNAGQRALQHAAERLGKIIDEEWNKIISS